MKLLLCCSLIFYSLIYVQSQLNPISVSDDEINGVVQQLLAVDNNFARSNHLTINYQQYSNSKTNSDASREKLFSYVSPQLLRRPTYSKLNALFDNYLPNTGEKEIQTDQENREIEQFLQSVFSTAVFNKTYQFLHQKKHPSAKTVSQFQTFVKHLWFDSFSRQRGVADTSGFEHVFIGEIVRGESEVGGMHNWLRFHQLEESGAINYAGFVVKRGTVIAAVQYQWNNVWKSTGSFMIGTSPEFDLSVYTLCFLMKPGFRQCQFEINNCNVQITSHALQQNGKTYIGTVFPSPGRTSNGCR